MLQPQGKQLKPRSQSNKANYAEKNGAQLQLARTVSGLLVLASGTASVSHIRLLEYPQGLTKQPIGATVFQDFKNPSHCCCA